MISASRLLSKSIPSALTRARFISTTKYVDKIVAFKLSDIGEGIAEVQVKEWHVKPGDHVNQFDPLCEVESDKATVTITSRFDGKISKLHHEEASTARVGQALVDIDVADDAAAEEATPAKETESRSKEAAKKPEQTASSAKDWSITNKVPATPAVRRIAMENNVELSDISATGKNGRVLKEDILRFIGKIDSAPSSSVSQQSFQPLVEDKIVPIRGYTKAMIKTMTIANNIPHFGYRDEVVVDRLVDLREQLKEMAKERGVKMSYMPLFVKAASMALHEYPGLNAKIDEKVENVIQMSSHNICIAIDSPGGLVVPNIKNCEQRSLWEIASELNRLIEAAAKQQLSPSDLANGTFTLSNIGSIGGTYAHPVIFPPQVAIGALGKMTTVPRYRNDADELPVRTRSVPVSWCADHRVIDGAMMARFSNRWKAFLENPALMIAQMR